MIAKTPIKSLHVSQKTKSISPQQTKSSKISSSRLSEETNHQQKMRSLAQFSLVQKIIESSIVNDCEYQNLLIRNKQFELKILAEEQLLAKMKKQYKRANQPIQQCKEKITKSKNSVQQKKQYLQKFYHHLDNRLKTNANSNLFGKLQKIQAALIEKYQQQRTQLYSTLQRQQQMANHSNVELQRLRQIRDDLIQKYTQKTMKQKQMQIQKQKKLKKQRSQAKQQSMKSVKVKSQIVSKQSSTKIVKKEQSQEKLTKMQVKKIQSEMKKSQIQVKNQSTSLQNSKINEQTKSLIKLIQKLNKEKQQIQKQQKVLKTILNIQQQHKKFSTYISNGYKKLFSIKYRQLLLKTISISNTISKSNTISISKTISISNINKVKPHDDIDLESIQKQIINKQKERKEMESQVQQRNIALQIARQKFNQMINQYSQLEFQINQQNNTNHSVNPKSTRTSYSRGE